MIWGLHRDTAEIRAIGLPVFSLGAKPVGPQRLDPRDAGALQSAEVGDWTIGRDDVVFGDDDGVLFVPGSQVAEIHRCGGNVGTPDEARPGGVYEQSSALGTIDSESDRHMSHKPRRVWTTLSLARVHAGGRQLIIRLMRTLQISRR